MCGDCGDPEESIEFNEYCQVIFEEDIVFLHCYNVQSSMEIVYLETHFFKWNNYVV